MRKIVAIVGSYRKGGIIDSAIDEVLAAARAAGGKTEKIYLISNPAGIAGFAPRRPGKGGGCASSRTTSTGS